MIASRKHNFIFIKTIKTAGTTIELVLGPRCGPEDTVTPINIRYDRERARQGIFPRHYGLPEIEIRYLAALCVRNKKAMKAAIRENRVTGCSSHAGVPQIQKRVGMEFWSRAFKFTSERHPYEKVLSLAAMDGLTDFDHTVFEDKRYIGHKWYLDAGKLLVDRFILFDRLADDFGQVLGQLGFPVPDDLPRAWHKERDRRPAAEQLTPAQKAFIYEQCAPEFELFGWER